MAPLHPLLLPLLHLAAVAIGLLAYVALTHSGRQRRAPSAALAWVISLVAIPYVALPAYLLFGTRKVARAPGMAPRPPAAPADAGTWSQALSLGLDLPPPRSCASIAIEPDGARALQSLLALLDGAARSIDIEMFIFRDDAVGRKVAASLLRAGARGASVRVLLDGIGAFAGRRRTLRLLRGSGVEVRWFSPLRMRLRPQFGRGNLRNHRKLAIVDGRTMWSGGRNIAAEYFTGRDGMPAWDDLSFTIDGGTTADAVDGFALDWATAGGATGRGTEGVAAGSMPGASAGPGAAPRSAGARAQLLPSGPDRRDDTAYDLFISAIARADVRILIATPYFVPDDALQLALALAARRGVAVELLLPARSNHALADIARERSLRELSAAGAHVRLLPRMLHAKAIVVDTGFASCGSVNLDARSLFLNYELNMLFHDSAQVEALAGWFTSLAAGSPSHPARRPGWTRDLVEGVVRSVAFQL